MLQGVPAFIMRVLFAALFYPAPVGRALSCGQAQLPSCSAHRLLSWVGAFSLLDSGPSLCPSQNGVAPTSRSPFPLLAVIKAQTPMPKSQEGGYLGPSEAAQHLPEGVWPDLDHPGEGVVELGDGEEYAADDQRQGRDHKPVRHVALKPE